MLFRKKTTLPSAAEALPGRQTPLSTSKKHLVLDAPLKGPYPEGIETAYFGMGCFWGAERLFWQLGRGIYTTGCGLPGRRNTEPHLRGNLHRPDGPCRSGPRRFRS